MKILAVDDDEIALEILASALRNSGYTDVETAKSAQDAIDLMHASDDLFECFLLDLVMPGMDGIDLCAALRATELYTHTPIVMITAVRDQCHIDRAFAKGATDYVTKPFIGIELGARIRAAEALAALVRRERELTHDAAELVEKLKSIDNVALTDRFGLEDTAGAVRFKEMETAMLRLPDGTYAMEVMALRILEISHWHEKLSSDDFRKLINIVGQTAADCAEKIGLQIAYVGEGCFACIVKSHGARLPSGFANRARAAVESLDIDFLNGVRLTLEIAMGKTEQTTMWTGREVVAGLHHAIAKVRAGSLRKETDAALAIEVAKSAGRGPAAWRHGGTVRRLVPELFQRADQISKTTFTTPESERVAPRRVTSKTAARG